MFDRKEYNKKYKKEHPDKTKDGDKKYRKKYKTEINEKKRSERAKNIILWMNIIRERGMDRCSCCGYDKCFAAIDFHHRQPTTKKRIISWIIQRPVTVDSLVELDKTVSLCKNCHTEYHILNRTMTDIEFINNQGSFKA